MGVSLSMDKVWVAYEKAESKGVPCYVYGEIVHNSHVMHELETAGIKSILSPGLYEPGVILIRAHGISDKDRAAFIDKGFDIVDATCPVVLRNQALVRNSSLPVIILGLRTHAEVVALLGSKGESEVYAVSTPEDLLILDASLEYNAVLQTTFSDSVKDCILLRADELGIKMNLLNSICSSSEKRRAAVEELKKSCDMILVVGDRKSSNTNELLQIAKKGGKNAFLIENSAGIPDSVVEFDSVGITAGASTPAFLYKEVERRLKEI